MFWPCETRTSTCRSFATISSGLYRFLAIAVLLDVKDIPQVGPLQWGWITRIPRIRAEFRPGRPLAFELQRRGYAARGWVLPGSSASVLHGRWPIMAASPRRHELARSLSIRR